MKEDMIKLYLLFFILFGDYLKKILRFYIKCIEKNDVIMIFIERMKKNGLKNKILF